MRLRDIYSKIGFTGFSLLTFFLLAIVFGGLGLLLVWKPWLLLLLLLPWGIIPCLSWAVNIKTVSQLLTDERLKMLRYVFIGIVVAISYVFFLSWNELRDTFGYACVRGYSAHYTDEYDDERGNYEQAHISANNWFVEKLLISSMILFLLPLAAVNGILTWRGITKEIKRRDLDYESQNY